MKKLYFLSVVLVALFAAACDFSRMHFTDADAIDSICVERYDREEARYLTTGDYAALQEMNTTYHKQTRALIEDILGLGIVSDQGINKQLLEYFQDSTLQVIIHDSESQYADMGTLTDRLRDCFGKLKRELPEMPIPEFYAQIGALNQSIVVDDRQIGISIDKYLGSDYPIYKRYYDAEQRKSMCREYIVPDCMVFYLVSVFPLPEELLSDQQSMDMHMATMLWVANNIYGKKVFRMPMIEKVDAYMKQNNQGKQHTIKELVTSLWWRNQPVGQRARQ